MKFASKLRAFALLTVVAAAALAAATPATGEYAAAVNTRCVATQAKPWCTFYCDPTSFLTVRVVGSGYVEAHGDCWGGPFVWCDGIWVCMNTLPYVGGIERGFCHLHWGDFAVCETDLTPPVVAP